MCTVDKLLIKGIRSFSPDNTNVIEFYKPLTLIVGANGAGKTTVIECLKQACTGELPPNTRAGQSFIHDPRMANETDIKAQIKLRFLTSSKQPVVVVRSFQLSEKKTTRQFKTLDSTLQTVDPTTGAKQAVTYRCIDIDKMVPSLMGVSKAVLENVIFVHQEESNWPLAEGKVLKEKFDDIFSATKYTKALETLNKLKKEKAGEIKVSRMDLDHHRTIRDGAAKLQGEMQRAEADILDGEEKIQNLDQQIREKSATLDSLQDTLERLKALAGECQIRRVRREEQNKQFVAKLEALQADGVTVEDLENDTLEALQQTLADIDAAVEQDAQEVKTLQRSIQAKRLSIQAENQQQNRDVERHGRLNAERTAHTQRLSERERFMRDTAASLGWAMPGSDTPAAQQFLTDLGTLVNDRQEHLKNVKKRNRKEDEDAAQHVDSLTAQITRKQEELRVKQDQVASNNNTIDTLLAQIASIHSNERMLEDSNQRIEDIGDQLRKRHHEQANGKLDEKVASLKRELDDLAVKISELRSERDSAAGSSETQVQLRLKRAAIADKESKIQSVLSRHRRDLLQLLGTADLPAPSMLKTACNSALATQQQSLDAQLNELKSMQTSESQIKGQLTASRTQLSSVTQQQRQLNEQVALRKTQLQLQEDVLNPQALATLLAQAAEAVKSKRAKLEKFCSTQDFIVTFKNSICDSAECPVCCRAFNSAEERQRALDSLDADQQALPEKIPKAKQAAQEAESRHALLQELHSLVSKRAVLEAEQVGPLTQRKEALEHEHSEASLKAESLVDEVAVLDAELKKKKEVVSGVLLTLEHTQQELSALQSDVGRCEARLSSQSAQSRSVSDIDDQLQDLEDERRNKERERETALRKLSKLKEEILKLTQEEAFARSQVMEANAAKEKKQDLSNKVEELQAMNKELEGLIQKLSLELRPLSSTREGHIRDRSVARTRMQALEEAAEAELREASKLADALADKNRPIIDYELSGQAAELESMASKMRDFQRKITSLNQDLEAEERTYIDCQKSQAEKDKRKRLAQDCVDMRRIQIQLAAQEDEIRELERQQTELGASQELVQQAAELNQACASLQRQVDRLQGSKATHQETRARAEKDLQAKEYRDIHIRYNRLLAELMFTEMANNDLDKYYKALEKALLSFHTTKMADINKIVRELWQKTYRGQDIDYIKIVADAEGAGTRSYNYRVIMVVGGAELEMRGRCSAGQKVLACLVIRLALAETFCLNCGILALDEPTTNLDSENASSLAEALKSIMFARKDQENFQLIVITHDEEFAHHIGTRDHAEYLWRIMKDESQHTYIQHELIT